MAEKRTIELEIKDNANDTQQQFENLRQQIAKTTQEVEELTSAYGENSQEVSEAKNKLSELTTSYTNLNKVATDTGATFADVYGEMQPLTTRMGEAEDRLYELALAGQTASQEYQDLLQKTQNYLRVQQQVDLQVEAGAVPAAQKMTMAVGGVAGAFGVAEGAAALFGVESSKLQETMVKLQAVMTITQSITSIKEAIPTFQALKTTVTTAFNAMSTAQKAFAVTGIGALVVGLGLLIANWDKVKKALDFTTAAQKVSNQVTKESVQSIAGELNAADKLSKQLKDETLSRKEKIQKVKEFQAAYPGLLKNVNLETMSIDQINKQLEKNIELLKLQAKAKAIQSIREEEFKKQLTTQTNTIGENLSVFDEYKNAAVGSFLGINYSLNQNIKDSEKNKNKIIAHSNEKIKALDEFDKTLQKDIDALKKQGAQTDENSSGIQDFSKNVAGFTNVIDTNTDALDKQRESLENTADLQKQIVDEQIKQIKDEETRSYEETKLAAQRRIEEIKKIIADEKVKAELIKEVEANLQNDLIKISEGFVTRNRQEYETYKQFRKQNAKDIAEQELNIAKEEAEQTQKELDAYFKKDQDRIKARFAMMDNEQLEEYNRKAQHQQSLRDLEELNANGAFKTQEEYLKALDILETKYAEKDIARKNELRQKTLDLTAKSFSALAELAGSFNTKNEKDARKQFQVQKAFNLAAAITNTAMAVTGALTAGGNPIKLATGQQFVEAGIAGAVGAANIIKIANSKFGSGNSSSNSSNNSNASTGAAPMTANFTTIGSSGINQLAQLQQTPTQAYVVSGEVTSAQALDRNRVQNATL